MNPSMLASTSTLLTIRCFDLILSSMALLVLMPLLLFVAMVLRFTGEHIVFYRQVRIGKGGREFYLLKFATMLNDSPNIGTGELTLPGDPRVLPLGRILRKTKLNELPQLWNVLLGDLSIIGPRPQTHGFYACYKEEDRIWIDRVRPGLSGVASILFRNEEALLSRVTDPVALDRHVIMPYKGQVEHWFAINQTLSLYFELIFLTACVVVLPSSSLHRRLILRLPPPPVALYQLLNS